MKNKCSQYEELFVQTASAEELGFPVDSYGLLMVDE